MDLLLKLGYGLDMKKKLIVVVGAVTLAIAGGYAYAAVTDHSSQNDVTVTAVPDPSGPALSTDPAPQPNASQADPNTPAASNDVTASPSITPLANPNPPPTSNPASADPVTVVPGLVSRGYYYLEGGGTTSEYCTFSYDDGSMKQVLGGSYPTPSNSNVKIQFDCPDKP